MVKYKLTVVHNPETTNNRAPSVYEFKTFGAWNEYLSSLRELIEGAGTSSIKQILTEIVDA